MPLPLLCVLCVCVCVCVCVVLCLVLCCVVSCVVCVCVVLCVVCVFVCVCVCCVVCGVCVCVCVCCVCVCVCLLYACSASSFSGRRLCSWTVQDSGNGEDYVIPSDGNDEPVYDFMEVNPAIQCGDNRDEGAGPSEPRYATPHSARALRPMKQKVTLL